MKKACKYIFGILLEIIATPFIILAVLWLIILIPFDYFKYKNSCFYKKEKEKYTLFAGNTVELKIYNEIVKNMLPIRYVKNPNDTSITGGWFIFDKTLIIINGFWFGYDEENKKWTCEIEKEDLDEGESSIITLDEYVETELQEFNEIIGEPLCNDAIVLIDEEDVDNPEMARSEERFLTYTFDRVAKLKRFCKEKWSYEYIVEILYDKQLDSFLDEVVNVLYSKDKSMRYVILKKKRGILTYLLEKITLYDDDEWGCCYNQEYMVPAMWETCYNWTFSHYENEEDLMSELVHEPEYKYYFV